MLVSCGENTRTKFYGATKKVELPKGQKLVSATWKETSLWYLTEPMDENYMPKQKTFSEMSNFGLIEGDVIFIESK